MTTRSLEEKEQLLAQWHALIDKGKTKREAADQLGVPVSNLYGWWSHYGKKKNGKPKKRSYPSQLVTIPLERTASQVTASVVRLTGQPDEVCAMIEKLTGQHGH